MKENLLSGQRSNRLRWPWILAAACILVVLLALRQSARKNEIAARDDSTNPPRSESTVNSARTGRVHPSARLSHSPTSLAAAEIVAAKVNEFARNRREIVRALARHHGIDVPPEVEHFFELAEAGRWKELDDLYASLKKRREEMSLPAEVFTTFWPAMNEMLGVSEAARDWPPQKLLDYGNAVLGSLRPGMIYVGGTDPGRYIPTLLNETSDGDRHVVLTQNALADLSYLNYASFLYGDRLAALTQGDSDRAFQDYIADARKRFDHDQQFPNEPRQLRPGEDVKVIDNRVQVSGQVAVQAINEKLLQTLMQKNPDASFAMEESFPYNSMFAEATTLGPIMELRLRDEQNTLTRERAAQSVDYWRGIAQQISSDPDARDNADVLKSYSKLVSSQGGLFANRNFPAEAEQAFRLATEICPYSEEAVFRLVNLLVEQNRPTDALPVVENAIRADSQNQQFRSLIEQLKNMPKK